VRFDDQEIGRQIREYVIASFYVADPAALSDNASLIHEGVIDSTGMLEMVAFLEATFGIAVGDEEMVPENLDSIARAVEFVRHGLAVPASDLVREVDRWLDACPRGGARR
jgi:acyl carrier protein